MDHQTAISAGLVTSNMRQRNVTIKDKTALQVDNVTIDAGREIIDHLVHDDRIFIITRPIDNQNLSGYSLKGDQLWIAPDVSDTYIGIFLRDGKVVAQTSWGDYYTVDSETGEVSYTSSGR